MQREANGVFAVCVLNTSKSNVLLSKLVGVLIGKSVLGGMGALVMRFPLRVAVLAGVGLAQIGEFSFVLANAGLQVGLLSDEERDLFVCMSVLTMAVTPVALSFAPRLAAGVAHLRPLEVLFGAHGPHRLEPEHEELSEHFIVAGLGTAGRMVVRALRASNLPHVVIDLDPHVVAEARRRGEIMGSSVAPVGFPRRMVVQEERCLT